MQDRVELCSEPLDVSAALAGVGDEGAGGIAVFVGTTRAQKNAAGVELAALEYEAYEEMALQRLQGLAAEARQRWGIARLVILHRLGRVEVGQASVFIGVSCPHRAEAFEACRWLIDQIKGSAPIWKQERWLDGAGSWVHPAGK